ncbi:MAG: guanylate kinase [Pseudomonadota bacterium]
MLIIVSAPSGCGKTTMVRSVLKRDPDLVYSISYTTRRPRSNERDGHDYHFVSRTVFEDMARSGAFAEWAEVHGQCYGTSARVIDDALRRGLDMIFDIDVQGAMRLNEKCSDAVLVFVLPPSMDELRHRLLQRNTERPELVERRLAASRHEMAQAWRYDYFIVNDDLEQAVEALHRVVLAERLKRGGTISV